MTILGGQSGLQWTDRHLDEFAGEGPNNARVAAAMRRVDPSMRNEVFREARRLLLFYAQLTGVRRWPEAVELVTAATLAGGSPRVFVQTLGEITNMAVQHPPNEGNEW